jgi:UPF0042 nucleotide-binding protein
MQIYLESFGYNLSGEPEPGLCQLTLDARHIQNPYRKFGRRSGLDPEVRDYVIENSPSARELVKDVIHKAHVEHETDIAVGCSFGHHRSVAVVEAAAIALRALGHSVKTYHRELAGNPRFAVAARGLERLGKVREDAESTTSNATG